MEMTYDQYIQNPMGKKNSVISNREMYRKMYTEKWDAIKVRENGIIEYMLMSSKTDFYIYIKIPSEVVPKFYYDVVIRFFPPKGNNVVGMERTLENYNVQFYSNDPSFVFTFAHAFHKNNMFLNDMSPKMSKFALKEKAEERNPKDQIGYVKSLYFAYIEMKRKGLFKKSLYIGSAPYDKRNILPMITDADEKITQRQKQGELVAKKARNEKRKATNQKRQQQSSTSNQHKTGNIHITSPSTGNAHNIGSKSKISGKSKITGRRKI